MAAGNLILRFLEVLGIGALAYTGSQASSNGLVRVIAGIGAPLVLIVIWALVVTPNTASGLSQPQKDAIGTVLLLVAAAALGFAGQPRLAIAFAILLVTNAALLFVFGQDARSAFVEMGR